MARFHGKGMGGGAAASSRTRSITDSRKPEEGISGSSDARMLSILLDSISSLPFFVRFIFKPPFLW
jgi:hypothetical protein